MKTVAKTSRILPGERYCTLLLTVACVVGASLSSLRGATVNTIAGGAYPPAYPALSSAYSGFWDGTVAPNNIVRFNNPRGMAVMPDGNLLVADRDNNAIRVVNFSAARVDTWLRMTNQKPVAVQVSSSGTVYILSTNGICSYDTNHNILATNVLGGAVAGAVAMTMDGSGNFYVAIPPTTVKIFSSAGMTNKAVTNLVSPSGIALMKNGLVAVTEANHQIRTFNPADAVPTLVVLAGSTNAGSAVGGPAFARFNSPEGIAVAPNGSLVVADRFNHQLRVVETNGYVSILAGVNWGETNSPFPGWADGTYDPASLTAVSPASREPAGVFVAASGDVYVTENYYHVLRKVTGTALTVGGGGGGGGGSGTTNGVVDAPAFTPNWGYYPNGQSIMVNSIYTNIIYTTDGSDPTTNNGKHVTMSANVGVIRWQDGTKDLSSLKVRAFDGTNASVVVGGVAPPINQISVTASINTNYSCAVGEKVYIPVVLNLVPGQVLKTFSYRVKLMDAFGSPTGMASVVYSTDNDFIKVNSSGITNLTPIPGSNYIVAALGANMPPLNSSKVLHLLEVVLPNTAVFGNTYYLSVTNISGTADGYTPVQLKSGSSALITVRSNSFAVGDVAPKGWYNAGEFGDENIDNSDVNCVYYVSLGLYNLDGVSASAVFNAMDAANIETGDTDINYLDWSRVLLKAVRDDTNRVYRRFNSATKKYRSFQTNSLPGMPDGVGDLVPLLPGAVWTKDVRIQLGSVGQAVPGAMVRVPVIVNSVSDKQLSGLMFTVKVSPSDSFAPALTVPPTFELASGVRPALQIDNHGLYGESLLDRVFAVWSEADGDYVPWTGSNLLGYVKFVVPPAAPVGTSYRLKFVAASGVAPGAMDASDKMVFFECVSGAVYVQTDAPIIPTIISDSWCTNFFGANALPLNVWNLDDDGDGIPNWKEYLAGTNPTNAESRLGLFSKLEKTGPANNLRLKWVSAPKKTYVVEWAANFVGSAWIPIATNIGNGDILEINETNLTPKARFYRIRLIP